MVFNDSFEFYVEINKLILDKNVFGLLILLLVLVLIFYF